DPAFAGCSGMKRRHGPTERPVSHGAPSMPVFAAMVVLVGGIAAGCRAGQARAPELHVVETERFVFRPDTLRVEVGDTVAWLNRDLVPHTATDGAGAWDSGIIGTAAECRLVPAVPGVHRYGCALHPTMEVVLIVEE